MSRPWSRGRERVAAWWALMAPDGRTLGIFLRMTDVDAWVDRHPGEWWRVSFWFRGTLRNRCEVRSKPGWARAPNEPATWRRVDGKARRRKGGGDGGDE